MNIYDLTQLGFTNYELRTIIEECNSGNAEYSWLNETLIVQGTKKPKIDPELFIERYREFKCNQAGQAAKKHLALLKELEKGSEPS